MSDQSNSEDRVIRDAVASAQSADRTERFDHRWYVVWLGVLLLQAVINAHDAFAANGSVLIHAALAFIFTAAFLWILAAEIRAYGRRHPRR